MPSSLDASVFRMFISLTVQVKIQILPVITTYEIFFFVALFMILSNT
jgi:hypothetical protein